MTNGDKIRAMTDEELAICFLFNTGCAKNKCKEFFEKCEECWKDWLQQEAEE